jgi:outer membrane protein TolC
MMSGLVKSNWRFGGAGWLLAAALLLPATGTRAGPAVDAPGNPPHPPATNQPTPPWLPTGPLTVEQVLQRALDSDGRIQSLKAAVQVAREQRLAATDLKDPELQAESRTSGQSEEAASDDFENSRIKAELPLPNPWLMVPHVDARAADYQAAQADLKAATWLLKCEVRQLFAQLDFLTNELAFSADLVRLNDEVLTAVQSRAGQGAATASDLMTASRQNVQAQNDFDQAIHNYQAARRRLASLLDVSPESFELATNPAAVPAPPAPDLGFEKALATAAMSRSDLAALRWRAQAAESSYHEVWNQKIPWIKAVQAGYMDNSVKDSDKYWVGLAVEVPIFAWTKNHAADAALAQAQLAGVEATNGLRQIRQELRDALDELDQTRRQLTRFATNISPLITTMRQTLATLKRTPDVMPEQVAAAELQLVETLRLELNTRWQYQLALFDLERTLGTPLNQ